MKIAIISSAVVVLALIVGGAWWFVASMETTDTTTSEQQTDGNDEEAEAAAIVTYSDTGFSVSKDTIPAGSTVLIVNSSKETLMFASDPHPNHTDNPELNLPTLDPGEQETMIIEKPGKWGFHNHLNDDHSGSMNVTN